jgi:hypothetical protein
MKNLLLLFLIFSFTSLFSQETKVTYLRAQSASMGVREDENSVVSQWIVDGREVNMLVELHQTKVIIYSQKTQNYYIIKQVEQEENSWKWLCKDSEANSCYVALRKSFEYPGLITVAVEYNDLVWFYICTHE